jgi:D-glycero-alpha-D-manno-heptose-7-phosphate kinase
MFITVKRPFADKLIRLKYNISETVEKVSELKHDIARECLTMLNVKDSIDVVSMADIPAGSGMGSSSSYTIGLLNAIHTMKREYLSLQDLAEEACEIEMFRLNKPMGKQDQYLAAFGGFTVLEIAKDGVVEVKRANISNSTIDALKSNLLSFYTGIKRKNVGILAQQNKATEENKKSVLDSLNYIKDSGYKILDIVESGNITELGQMFDEHWRYKKKLAKGITNPQFDEIYEIALQNGALGGKISGAGGGGFFLFYCEEKQAQLRKAMSEAGLKEMRFDFDYEGTKVLVNFMDYTQYGNGN